MHSWSSLAQSTGTRAQHGLAVGRLGISGRDAGWTHSALPWANIKALGSSLHEQTLKPPDPCLGLPLLALIS